MNAGDRVRFVESVWPERVGCVGTVVAPPTDGTYPQPATWEVLVRLDDDPFPTPRDRPWSCVTAKSSLMVIEDARRG